MKIPFLDLTVKDAKVKKELLEAVDRVLSHGKFFPGPEINSFEKTVATYCGKKYALGVGSGTDALYMALRALDVGPGDEVLIPPLSMISTLNSIVLCGASPVFVDIGEDLNMNTGKIAAAITPKTKAIMPVHFTGSMCNMEKIMEIAKQKNISVIEDAAQAFGASLHDKKAGAWGDVNCFSMNPMKVLAAFGEAGAIVTDDVKTYDKLHALRYSGLINKEDCHYPSLNGKIDTIQAAMLLVQFNYLDRKIERRREIANMYKERIGGVVQCPLEEQGYLNTYYTYTIQTKQRDRLQEYLSSKGIETKIYFKRLMPDHTAYTTLPKQNLPLAEKVTERILAIPNHENLTDMEVDYIADCCSSFFQKKGTL